MTTLILASGSPRRREILENLGYTVCRLPADIDETPRHNESPHDYVLRLACEKNRAIAATRQDLPIVSADTSVVLGNEILGKPESPEHAEQMLLQLSGKAHQVLTGVCVSWQGKELSVVQANEVFFKPLSTQEIRQYIATGEPMDKAGAYGIQGLASVFISHLSGSFSGVMGLPVFETVQMLRECGVGLPALDCAN